jgi:anti-anti-sigma regulatory factor
LQVKVLETATGVVVHVRGTASIAEAAALESSLLGLLARRPACVSFDLSELELISSLAMGVLVAFRRAAVRTGARVSLAPTLQPAVREALTRAELIALFDSVANAESCGEAQPVQQSARNCYPSVSDLERTHGLTWGQLVEREPRLEPLLWQARTAGTTCRTFADVDRVFAPLRNELAALLGFAGKHHRHPILGSAAAYEVAYWKLRDAVAGLLSNRAGR